jgi:hypothetical protein
VALPQPQVENGKQLPDRVSRWASEPGAVLIMSKDLFGRAVLGGTTAAGGKKQQQGQQQAEQPPEPLTGKAAAKVGCRGRAGPGGVLGLG